jgi:hypothetical protein
MRQVTMFWVDHFVTAFDAPHGTLRPVSLFWVIDYQRHTLSRLDALSLCCTSEYFYSLENILETITVYFVVDILTFINPINPNAVVHFFLNGPMLKVPWKVRYLSSIPGNTKTFQLHVPVSWYLRRRTGNFRPKWQNGLSRFYRLNQNNCLVQILT